MLARRIIEPPVAKEQRKFHGEVEDHEDDLNESVIDTLLGNQQVNAKRICVFYICMVVILCRGQRMRM